MGIALFSIAKSSIIQSDRISSALRFPPDVLPMSYFTLPSNKPAILRSARFWMTDIFLIRVSANWMPSVTLLSDCLVANSPQPSIVPSFARLSKTNLTGELGNDKRTGAIFLFLGAYCKSTVMHRLVRTVPFVDAVAETKEPHKRTLGAGRPNPPSCNIR